MIVAGHGQPTFLIGRGAGHQPPLGAVLREAHPHQLPPALDRRDHALAERGVHHRVARGQGRRGARSRRDGTLATTAAAAPPAGRLGQGVDRELAQEARGQAVVAAAVHRAALGVGEHQVAARPREAHVEEAPLLLERLRACRSARAGRAPPPAR